MVGELVQDREWKGRVPLAVVKAWMVGQREPVTGELDSDRFGEDGYLNADRTFRLRLADDLTDDQPNAALRRQLDIT
jgi:hypothetical protein